MLEGVDLLLTSDDRVAIDRFENEGRCELLFQGELRLDDAREVFERAQAEDCSRVVLDFSGCEVEDRALSALADLLNEGARADRRPGPPGAAAPAPRISGRHAAARCLTRPGTLMKGAGRWLDSRPTRTHFLMPG